MEFLKLDGYKQIPAEEFARLRHLYDTDVAIQKVVKIRSDSQYAGGLLVTSKSDQSGVHNDPTWRNWTQEASDASIDCYGFSITSFRPDNSGNRIPVVWDPAHFIFMYKLEDLTTPVVRLYDPEVLLTQGPEHALISPEMYLVHWDKPPDANGSIRSKVALVFADKAIEDLKLHSLMKAERLLTEPQILLEPVEQKHDESKLTSVTSYLNPPITSTESTLLATHPDKPITMPIEESATDRATFLLNHLPQSQLEEVTKMIENHVHRPRHNQVHLPREYKLVTNTAPANLNPDYILFRANRNETVCLLWGVPFSMFNNGSTTSKSSMGNGNNDNARVIFDYSQMQHKSLTTEMIKQQCVWMENWEKVVTMMKKNQCSSDWAMKELRKKEPGLWDDVVIDIPSIPDKSTIVYLWKMRLLKPETLVKKLCLILGLNREDFVDQAPEWEQVVEEVKIDEEDNEMQG